MKLLFKRYQVFLLIVCLGFFFQSRYLKDFPRFVHAWAQADRYALALGFVNNNLNFFKPETYVLNHQFPDNWMVPGKESITAVDFPIHDYIPALLMKFTGKEGPIIFRLYILIYSFAGLFFLFKLSLLFTKKFYRSLFILLFAATSPVFVYYQSGFLPSIPSLSNAIIGSYFYCRYLQEKSKRDFHLSLFFLTLAVLSRFTFVILLADIFFIELFRLWKKETGIRGKYWSVALSIGFIGVYYAYNIYLRKKHGSIFLNHLMPPSNLQEAREILKQIYNNWGSQYFSIFHYILFLLISGVSLFFTFKKGIDELQLKLGIYTIVAFTGYFVFAIVMLRQFPAHDYYFLDSFFLPCLLLLIFMLSVIPPLEIKSGRILAPVLITLISLPLILLAERSQKQRRITGPWDRINETVNNFNGSDKLLDSIGISKNAKLLVLDVYAPNIPFILLKRKGYAVLNTRREIIDEALKWPYDYIIVQDEYFASDILSVYPEITSLTRKVADNGRISILSRH